MKNVFHFMVLGLLLLIQICGFKNSVWASNGKPMHLNESALFCKASNPDEGINAILKDPSIQWKKVPAKGFSKPYDQHTYWIQIPVEILQDGIYFLENNYTMLEAYQLYVVSDSGRVFYNGDMGLKAPSAAARYRLPVFELELKKGNYRFFLKIAKKFSTAAQSFTLYDAPSFSLKIRNSSTQQGIVYGIFIFLLLQGIITSIFFRSRNYWLYAGYVLSLIVILAVSDGSIRLLLPGEVHLEAYFLLYYALLFSFVFLMLLFTQLVPVERHLPRLIPILKVLFGLSFGLLLLSTYAFFALPDYPTWAYKISNSLFLIFPILLIGLSIYFFLQYRYRQALWLIIVFGLTLLFIAAFALLPYINYDFAEFMQFKWIILFEGVAVLIVLNRDFYLTRKENSCLQLEILEEQHRASMNYLTGISDERKRMATQLHDEISIQLSVLKMEISEGDTANKEQMDQFSEKLDLIHQQIRSTSHALSPVHLERKGLRMAIEEEIVKLEDHFPDLCLLPEINLHQERFASQTEEFVYWTFMELMHNIIKHAHASQVEIILRSSKKEIELIVSDDGVGYHPQPGEKEGIGLSHIRNRSKIAGGTFEIISRDKGMEHHFKLPLDHQP